MAASALKTSGNHLLESAVRITDPEVIRPARKSVEGLSLMN